jgi:AmmeMemoRadiSam system protein A
MFNKTQQNELLSLARKSIESRFTKEAIIFPEDDDYFIQRGIFVTLHKNGELRGCIGYIRGFKNLAPSISEMAQSAAFQDPRFSTLKKEELQDITIEISILSEMELVNDTNDIVIGRDGLFLNHRFGSGLLLPQVPVEWNWDLPTYLNQICIKAGIVKGSWKDEEAKLYRFSAEIFSEDTENSD